MAKIVELEIKDVVIPQGFLPRVLTGTVEEKVEEYKELLEEGVEFDPILVWEKEDGQYWVIDGVHRIEAHKRAGKERIKAKLLKCKDELDYRIKAIQANLKHGLALAKGERPILAQTLYRQGLSEEEIRKVFGVSERTVREWLKTVKEEEKREKIKKALELRKKGLSLREIAKELGMTAEGVRKILSTSGKNVQKLTLLLPTGAPTPEGLKLFSEFVELKGLPEDLWFSQIVALQKKNTLGHRQVPTLVHEVAQNFTEFLKAKGYTEVKEEEALGLVQQVRKEVLSLVYKLSEAGLSPSAIKAAISKENSGIFNHLSAAAKTKIAQSLTKYLRTIKTVNLVGHLGEPTPQGLRLWSEYVEQSQVRTPEDAFSESGFYSFLKNKGYEAEYHGQFMAALREEIESFLKDAVERGLGEAEVRTLLSKESRGSFKHISSTAKAKLEGLLRDYVLNLIQEKRTPSPHPPTPADLAGRVPALSKKDEDAVEPLDEEERAVLEEWKKTRKREEKEEREKDRAEPPPTLDQWLEERRREIRIAALQVANALGKQKALEILDEIYREIEQTGPETPVMGPLAKAREK